MFLIRSDPPWAGTVSTVFIDINVFDKTTTVSGAIWWVDAKWHRLITIFIDIRLQSVRTRRRSIGALTMAYCDSGGCDVIICCSRPPLPSTVAATSSCLRQPNISYFFVAEGGAHDTYLLARGRSRIDTSDADILGSTAAAAAAGDDDTTAGVGRDLLFLLKPAFYHNEVEILDDHQDEHKGEKRRRVVSAQTFSDMWLLELRRNADEPPKIFIGCSSYDKPTAPLFSSYSR